MWCIAIDEGAWICGVGCLSPLHLQPLAQVQVATWYPKLVWSCFPKIAWKLNDLEINHELKQYGEWRQIFFWRRMKLARRAGCCYRSLNGAGVNRASTDTTAPSPLHASPLRQYHFELTPNFLGVQTNILIIFKIFSPWILKKSPNKMSNSKIVNPCLRFGFKWPFKAWPVTNVPSAILHVMNVV